MFISPERWPRRHRLAALVEPSPEEWWNHQGDQREPSTDPSLSWSKRRKNKYLNEKQNKTLFSYFEMLISMTTEHYNLGKDVMVEMD